MIFPMERENRQGITPAAGSLTPESGEKKQGQETGGAEKRSGTQSQPAPEQRQEHQGEKLQARGNPEGQAAGEESQRARTPASPSPRHGNQRQQEKENRRAVHVSGIRILLEHQGTPGIEQQKPTRQTAKAQQDRQQRDISDIEKEQQDLHGKHLRIRLPVYRDQGPVQGEKILKEGRIDRHVLAVVDPGEDRRQRRARLRQLRLRDQGGFSIGRGIENRRGTVEVGIQACRRYPSIPDIAIDIILLDWPREEQEQTAQQGQQEYRGERGRM